MTTAISATDLVKTFGRTRALIASVLPRGRRDITCQG